MFPFLLIKATAFKIPFPIQEFIYHFGCPKIKSQAVNLDDADSNMAYPELNFRTLPFIFLPKCIIINKVLYFLVVNFKGLSSLIFGD